MIKQKDSKQNEVISKNNNKPNKYVKEAATFSEDMEMGNTSVNLPRA